MPCPAQTSDRHAATVATSEHAHKAVDNPAPSSAVGTDAYAGTVSFTQPLQHRVFVILDLDLQAVKLTTMMYAKPSKKGAIEHHVDAATCRIRVRERKRAAAARNAFGLGLPKLPRETLQIHKIQACPRFADLRSS